MSRRNPAARGPAAAGLALAAVGALSLWAHLRLPWMRGVVGLGRYRPLYREDILSHTPVAYERGLVHWPVAASAVVVALGLAVATVAWRDARRETPRTVAWALAVVPGYVFVLVGARWFGFYLARLADSGPSIVHLHVVPYLQVVLGAALLWLGGRAVLRWWRLAPPPGAHVRTAAGLALAAAATLPLLPLLPFAVAHSSLGSFHYDELTLAVLASSPAAPANRAAVLVGQVRQVVWTAGLFCVLLLAWARLGGHRATRPAWQRHAVWLAALPVAAGLLLAVRLWMAVPDMAASPERGPNAVPVLAFAGMAGILAWHGYRTVRDRGGATPSEPASSE